MSPFEGLHHGADAEGGKELSWWGPFSPAEIITDKRQPDKVAVPAV